jgi:hypothetical protein
MITNMKIRSFIALIALSVGLVGWSSSAPNNGSVSDTANDLSKNAAGTPTAPPLNDGKTAGSDAPAPSMGPKGIGKH